ncbi:MAG: AMP-binding protein [Geminicoccaceae bacterium]|nr:AMP-binding protein [Geminicoccaceae bacterium]HRY26086.1 AMP-binding protein [Geminicoccaceae bacterium]
MRRDAHLDPRPANFAPLTPLDFLRRSIEVFPGKTAVVAGARRLSYTDLGELVGRLAAGLRRSGIGRGDVVSVIAGNTPELLALHFAVPLTGAVLNAINTRLDPATVAHILAHAEARLVMADAERAPLTRAALAQGGLETPLVTLDALSLAGFTEGLPPLPVSLDAVADEWQPISLNYTSGTTGSPKGAVYHHRGAHLNALGNVMALGFDERSVYLWTLPMFHCNGWCHPWAVTAVGGTHVCLDRPDPAAIVAALREEAVTHFACAPVVLYNLLHQGREQSPRLPRRVRVATGGAAPTTALIEGLDAMGIELIHLYGLTESLGPVTACAERADWGEPDAAEKARLLARQGVRHPLAAEVAVVDAAGEPVPMDGATMGEIVIRSNTLMAGYLKDRAATEAAFRDGRLNTGDLAVRHPDGFIQIRDRAKDVIISGGENISSLEVEGVLHQHPAVLLAAVVAVADEKWGEVPVACLELKPGQAAPPAAELEAFCRDRLAHFKVPRRFVLRELPRTATGKIQKFQLRAELALD